MNFPIPLQFRGQFNMIAAENTTEKRTPVAKPTFWNNAKRYYDLKSYWINRFDCRVHKLPIDAGFTCPNRDGSVAAGGCIYCDGRGSALRRAGPLPSVGDQVRRGKAFYRQKNPLVRCHWAPPCSFFGKRPACDSTGAGLAPSQGSSRQKNGRNASRSSRSGFKGLRRRS